MKIIIMLFGIPILMLGSCKKFLDAKPDQSLATPSSLYDLQTLLDNVDMNVSSSVSNLISDEYYFSDSYWTSAISQYKNAYIWESKDDELLNMEWIYPFKAILYANIVLDNIDKVSNDTSMYHLDRNTIKGSALFYRAYAYAGLSQIFVPPYDSTNGQPRMGIPLRLTGDFNIPSVRSSVTELYEQIINDLGNALPLLPERATYKTRPSVLACYGLLARTYLYMGKYTLAEEYAGKYLAINPTLIRFDTLSATAAYPFSLFNVEAEYYAKPSTSLGGTTSISFMDTLLYRSYTVNDLRKTLYYTINTSTGTIGFKGSYWGASRLFGGIATDEVYLIMAESMVRNGKIQDATDYLNTLLATRYKSGTYIPLQGLGKESLLAIVLNERRKELVFRTARWSDIRRLNQYDKAGLKPRRMIAGKVYETMGNGISLLKIPQTVIDETGMNQNE